MLTSSESVTNVNSNLDKSGFGYLAFLASTVIAINNALPVATFGIVFGDFLSTLGDEIIQTSIANNLYNTIVCITGLMTNILLSTYKCSCRTVGLIGAICCSIGYFIIIFVKDLYSFNFCFGLLQGFGYGLLYPASLTALTNYFDKKLSFLVSLQQAIMIACCMCMPTAAHLSMKYFHYRGTLFGISIINFLNIPAAFMLSSFNCTYEKVPLDTNKELVKRDYLCTEKPNTSLIHTIERKKSLRQNSLINDPVVRCPTLNFDDKRRISVISLNGTIIHQNLNINADDNDNDINNKSVWKTLSNLVDATLLKNMKYVNISIGLSLSYTSDLYFIAIIPLLLSNAGFNKTDIAMTLSVFFGFDLLSRILLSVCTLFYTIKSRHIFFWGSLLSVIFRIAFIFHNSLIWTMFVLGALGFLRCLIQTPLPLVLSEEYPNQFATAYSLYMVLCGAVNLIVGGLMNFIKFMTENDSFVCHLLTSCYVICVISWSIERILQLKKQ